MEQYYNKKVRPAGFRPGEFVYRRNEASRVEDQGKLGPKWEGPYRVTEAFENGSYKLQTMEDKLSLIVGGALELGRRSFVQGLEERGPVLDFEKIISRGLCLSKPATSAALNKFGGKGKHHPVETSHWEHPLEGGSMSFSEDLATYFSERLRR
ncbi:hypothetical protein Tco_0809625 [Tanacetum coccineum]